MSTPPNALADESLHTALIKARLPTWVAHMAPVDVRRLKHGLLPGRERPATKVPLSPALNKALDDSRKASRQSREALAKGLGALQGIVEFAQPKLEAALREAMGEAPDVNKNQLHYLRYRQAPQQHSLLQAALLNFEGDEDFTDIALEQTSALAPEGALLTEYYGEARADGSRAARYRYSETLSMTPQTFSTLCRTLDLGQQYQAHLAQVFDAAATRAVVREQMIRAQKDLLTVRLYAAWAQGDIGPAVFLMLREVLAGTSRPLLDGEVVRFGQLSILGCELGEVLLIGPGVAPTRSVIPPLFPGAGVSGLLPVAPDTRVVAWIPGAPQCPLKEYPSMQAFDKELAVNLRSPAYQQLFASLVPQQQAPQFLERLKEKLYTFTWNPRGYKEQVYDEQINLNRRERLIEGELFGALYERHVQRLKDNARTLAVPTAEADRKAAQARHAHWLSMGLNTLNVAAFMVPGLGELLLAVTAIQLGLEVYHGIESWQEGDMDAAWEHLESVALNLGFMATLGGAAALAGRAPAIQVSKWVDGLVPVKLPNGERRLWKPDLAAYRSHTVLDASLKPNAQGQYAQDGKMYVRLGESLYEKAFDARTRKWRIQHPNNPAAYQPILEHNQAGAWRHTHERPLEWDRLTLLRRLGHETQGISDATLSALGDISGISDDLLRKVHIDGLPMPAVLADTLQLFRGAPPQAVLLSPEGAVLQRRFASLSRGAINEIISTASDKERLQILGRTGVAPRLDNLARRAVQQRRLSSALAGLYLPALASLDSDRLALHCLQQLPGWSPTLRLELRADNPSGRLLAEVGPEDAAVRRYLVKKGETFLACDLQGAPLNSPVPGSRNFYPSIVHALPVTLRQSLGLPLASADVDLQQALARYATAHRLEMAAVLKIRAPMARPALRQASGSLGYALSGRGTAQAPNAALAARVRDVYPNLSDEAAQLFVQSLLQAGQRPPQIYELIGNRERELTQLRMTLDRWVTQNSAQAGAQHTADTLINCWREGAYRGLKPHAYLSLGKAGNLPALDADFSHVRGLGVSGETLADTQGVRLAQQFPHAEVLNVFTEPAHVEAIATGLGLFPKLEELSIDGWGLTYSPVFLQRLNTLSQLRRLALTGALEALDVSGLKQLLALRVAGALKEWPVGVLTLDKLETLDLLATGINTMPAAMLEGHERLWRGLTLNWAAFERRAFMPVYQHVKNHPGHLVDEVLMVDAYCEGALRRLKDSDPAFAPSALAYLRRHRLTSDAKLTRVHALLDEHATLQQALEEWQGREVEVDRRPVDPLNRQRAADKLMAYWRDGLDRRFASPREVAGPSSPAASEGVMLDLSGTVLGDLPPMPAAAFAHVQRLNLAGTRVSVEALNDFLPQFTQIHGLDLSRSNLMDLPASLTQLRSLKQLDLAHNQLTITEAIQQRLSALVTLRGLNLDYNRVGTLDVSGLNQLRSLNLSHTATTAWPTGWLALPELRQVDLSYSAITTIPQAALTGHDLLMLSSNVRGCRLTLPACADIQRFALRTYQDNPLNVAPAMLPVFGPSFYLDKPLGIPREGLAEGRTGGDPEYFPLEVTDSPDLLLALEVEVPNSEVRQTPAQRLQQIDPALSTRDAVRRIDELLASGLGALEVEACLVRWRTGYRGMVRVLNDWIDIRGYRQGGGWVSAVDRRRAADRLIDSWRHTLRAHPEVAPGDGREVLQLNDLYLGDLPALPEPLAHVRVLNLNAVKLTEQGSNAFLRAFPKLRTLTLNNNGLMSLPDAVGECSILTELRLSHNELRYRSELQGQLNRLTALERLDLSENVLDSLDISSLPQLQSLELRGNNLLAWPQGVLQAAQLRHLDLRSNRIETIPEDALLPQHSALMWGTDLSDNLLFEEDLARLRVYQQQTDCGLGFSAEELEDALEGYHSTDSSSGSDIHPELLTPEQQKAQWFSGIAADSARHRVWSVLKQAENSEDFFYIISQLKNAQDFLHDRADLTRRVWAVLEAAEQYPHLREQLFGQARAMRVRATCGDGWILLFSDLEVSVYEFKALRALAPGQEGTTLFNLARRMIRLDEAERIAGEAINRSPGIDPAEIRLAYRIGLAERLDLPHQPSTMLYRNLSRVTQANIDQAYTAIMARESTPVFMQELVKRPYWVSYLQKLYPEEFSVLAQAHQVKVDALEELHPDLSAQYLSEVAALDTENLAEQQALALRLSGRARRDLGI